MGVAEKMSRGAEGAYAWRKGSHLGRRDMAEVPSRRRTLVRGGANEAENA